MFNLAIKLDKIAVFSLSVCLVSGPASAQTCYSDLIAFGDDLTDTGNIFDLLALPLPPYAPGRFSNGPIWFDGLAGSLGLSSLNSTSAGTNYAWAGARTGPAGGALPPSSLLDQVGLYLSDVGGAADPSALYVIWGGGNDARENLTADSANNIAAIISDLATAGATNFLVPNLLDMGKTPESQAGAAPGGTAADITAATLAHNAALAAELSGLSATLTDIKITELDVFTQFDQILSDPAAFGFANVTAPCWDGDLSGNGTQCANPGQYFFWDDVHPTAAAHALIGNEAFNLVVDTDGDCDPDIIDPDDDNDGISDTWDRLPLDDSNANCTTNDGTNATLVGAAISAEQTTCAAKESVDVSGNTNVGIGGDLLLISEKVSLTDTSVTDNGRVQVINADPCEGCGGNNLPPVIAFPTGGATFNNIAPVNLDPAATLSDVDSPDFDTGDLAVSVALSAAPSICDVSDLLTVQNQGMGVSQIGFDGTNVSFEGTVFGSVTMPYSCVDLGGGSFDITPLLITFDPDASQAAVMALLRALQYFTGSADDQDREANATVTDGDGGISNTAVLTITTNLNQAPIFSANNYAFDVDENSAAGTVVGTVTASDPDLPPQTLTFSISGGADQALFGIGASTGALSINTVLDYENPIDTGADNVYDVQVTVIDDGTPSLSDNAAVTVNVNDVVEP